MVLSTEWSQVEVIDLVNDGSGLGFGIVGGRSTGVVIKSILPGGIADKDGRLQSGDHILQIGEVHLRGLAADQVASVLRQAGPQVRMVVARPIEPSSADFQTLGCSAPIVPTKILTDPEELDRTLLQNGYTQICNYSESEIVSECGQINIAVNEIGCETVTGQCQIDSVEKEDKSIKIPLSNAKDNIEASVISEDSSISIQKINKNSKDKTDVVINSKEISENLNHTEDLNKLNDIKTNFKEPIQNCNGTHTNLNETSANRNELNKTSNGNCKKLEESKSIPNLDINPESKCSNRKYKESRSADELSNNLGNPSEISRELSNCSLLGPQFFTPVEIEYDSEQFTVTLHKNEFGLGITVAGYVCEREDLSGIFVKSLNEGSEAFQCGLIEVNDRIVEVDGESLENVTNHEAVEKLKRSGSTVTLTFERYLSGPKFEQLLEALASCNLDERRDISPASPSITTLSWIPIDDKGDKESEASSLIDDTQEKEIFIEEDFEANPEDDLETAIKKKWENIIGTGGDIVVANLTKLKGLGISLEGTVDVEGGVELRPHHYIRSILPEGPVGQNGKLSSGDELLEVNGQKLLGIKHVEVVKILKELPNTVRLVCARTRSNRVINTSQDREAFEARNILGGSLKNLLPQPEQKLLKAMSDTSINTSSSVTVTDELNPAPSSDKSKSLTNIAMWCEDPIDVDLVKSDKGLGFSILDYQDPLDEQSTIIVIRSVIPNGVAEKDGRISPGDRLVSVNGQTVKNYTLDQAVQALKGTPIGTVVKLKVAKPLKSSASTSR